MRKGGITIKAKFFSPSKTSEKSFRLNLGMVRSAFIYASKESENILMKSLNDVQCDHEVSGDKSKGSGEKSTPPTLF